jgi:hypothetical protein
MDSNIFDFGMHKGQPACDVPIDYLTWAATAMRSPPACIVMELRRRAALHGTRDAVEAVAAVSALGFRQARKAKRRRKHNWFPGQRQTHKGTAARRNPTHS